MLSCEITLYPLETENSDEIINQALSLVRKNNVSCEVGTISSFIKGDPEQVWQSIRTLYDAASSRSKELSMVLTVSNAQK